MSSFPYHIIVVRNGVEEYSSQFGGFNPDRSLAKEYSLTAAQMQVRNLHSISRHDEEHRYYRTARLQQVEEGILTT